MTAVAKKSAVPKSLRLAYQVPGKHWVGNGFHVHGLLRPTPELNAFISPFILMDYAAPEYFVPSDQKRGVGQHPHRGFETVTLAYQGEVEHRDSSGGGGIIIPGGVQWMTAGRGIVHDEFHSKLFTEAGGDFEMVQLWVNLPKKDKLTAPKYQGYRAEEIPVTTVGAQTRLRVIAGGFERLKGPASTFTEINVYDLDSSAGDEFSLELASGTNTILLTMQGEVAVHGETYEPRTILIFDQDGSSLPLSLSAGFKGLLLNGEPIDEPMVAHGPFVMNSDEEIVQAIRDFQSGAMGKL
ncbi:MAG: pirin family protein [Pseudobacteriovorax sp.]|nr:pirin family protein [Pseudobacteriovorax sp.]